MELHVRTITDAEIPAWCAAMNTGFLNPGGEVDAEARRPGLILDRTWGGFEKSRIVSTLRSFPTEMTVPGGNSIDVAAVTAVTTTSSHGGAAWPRGWCWAISPWPKNVVNRPAS